MSQYNTIDADILLSSGMPLDSAIIAILSSLKTINGKNNIVIIDDLSEIGVDLSKDSLTDIADVMPRGSVVSFHVSWQSGYGKTLPMPTLSNSNSPTYYSGRIFGYKNPGDFFKVYFIYISNHGMIAWSTVQNDLDSKFSGWNFPANSGLVSRMKASDFGGKMANIFVPCNYYFSGDQVALFTDAPPGAGAGYVQVVSQYGRTSDDRLITFTENGPGAKSWKMINYTGKWVTSPSVNNEAVPDNNLRIGDMKINSSGELVVRINSTTVKPL